MFDWSKTRHTKMTIQLGVHDADQLLQSQQLLLHSALIPVKVLFLRRISNVKRAEFSLTNHAIHNFYEAPKCHLFVAAHDNVDGCT